MYHSVASAPIASPFIPACHIQNGGDVWFDPPMPYAWPLPNQEDSPLFESHAFGASTQGTLCQQNSMLSIPSTYSPFDMLPRMSPLSMNMDRVLGLDFNPFDLDGFTFNTDNLPSVSSLKF
ncbi:hypothetical protein AZE42_11844 [Rhizopogon vesiculosus]|uniref:Uncharacterized protein n=1 Tax=Rhizopogon vesiculosus TaxID=180088 RepID=A0A1J8Q5H1_9AGAM|nr:hypothetical protein AZE42_11844 [Rhizopogon vesiculosus]